jgi:hypothetical protein
LIRAHGDAVEADLAFQGIDLRDLWRRGSGMTLRRLWVLVKALPEDALFRRELAAAIEKAQKPTPDKIRERAAYYERRAKEAENG